MKAKQTITLREAAKKCQELGMYFKGNGDGSVSFESQEDDNGETL